jgi:hypothetical protein
MTLVSATVCSLYVRKNFHSITFDNANKPVLSVGRRLAAEEVALFAMP